MTGQFDGFPPGRPRTAALPTLFFTDVLPLIDDLAELKVTLFAFYAVQQREGKYRYVRLRDFASSPSLMQSLKAAGDEVSALAAALKAAVTRGTLLCADVPLEGAVETIYFINAEPGRAAIRKIAEGKWQHGAQPQTLELMPERPNIYQLYEENIGALTGIIADHLKDAERDYPPGWVEDAIRLAVTHEKRSWKYVQGILERWRKEGKREVDRKPAAEQRAIVGNLDDFILE
ncbi:MAG: DnaD domain protein [Chloroflexota bacterium]|nr:DnaD domain protein [Chloroflexota bacterium]